jgi:nucleotide-binding universal stress UspA family protein
MSGFRDIVVDACPRPGLLRTLERARDIGRTFNAKLSVRACAWPRTSLTQAFAPNGLLAQAQTRLMDDALAVSRSEFEKVFGAGDDMAEWRAEISEPSAAMHAQLLTADLMITDSSEEDTCVPPNPARAALDAGIPVLRLGQNPVPNELSRVVVAWKDSPQARRAVHAALPILAKADRVAVVGVGDDVAEDRLEAVTAHLRCHEVKAHHRHVPATGGDVFWALIGQAQHEEAGLMVTGLYSRGLLTEKIFGGVTADLLKNAGVSWFAAH